MKVGWWSCFLPVWAPASYTHCTSRTSPRSRSSLLSSAMSTDIREVVVFYPPLYSSDAAEYRNSLLGLAEEIINEEKINCFVFHAEVLPFPTQVRVPRLQSEPTRKNKKYRNEIFKCNKMGKLNASGVVLPVCFGVCLRFSVCVPGGKKCACDVTVPCSQ